MYVRDKKLILKLCVHRNYLKEWKEKKHNWQNYRNVKRLVVARVCGKEAKMSRMNM